MTGRPAPRGHAGPRVGGPGADVEGTRADGGVVEVGAVRRAGDLALLVECADGREARALHAALVARPWPGQGELLLGARTVLVRLAPAAAPARGADALAAELADGLTRSLRAVRTGWAGGADGAAGAEGAAGAAGAAAGVAGRDVVLDTVYDGEDLDVVAAVLGTTRTGVVAAHTGRLWTASFVGFAPGFAYLEPDGEPWDVPRRPTPRTAVPAGSVALAGPYAAVYPRSSPGGWQLIGRTGAPMWDLARPVPALVPAGTRVRFRAVREVVTVRPGTGAPSGTRPSPPSRSGGPVPALRVLAPGALSLVEDLGRPGHLDVGVGTSGALDRRAAVRANRLVGNPRGTAVVETVLGGLALEARGRLVLAVAGAPAPLVVLTADGAERARPRHGAPFALHDGEVLRLGDPATGLRSYVAVRGGLAAGAVLGSRSTDVLSGLGPPPLGAGDVLGVLPPPDESVEAWPDEPREPNQSGQACATEPLDVRVRLGPRADRLTSAGAARLRSGTWTVSPSSNRVGLRLDGEPLGLTSDGELPSEGVVAGAVQVPSSGLPVVFLADHPVTGGYPVVAVVRDADLDGLAQVRPGDRLRFVVG